MQSGSREYIGRNEFWTPSTIGLTQSLIDTSINKIELKDNSSETKLFTVENNKLKSVIPMVCEDPTENEDVSNKKYIDNKITDLNTSIKKNYYQMSSIDTKLGAINTQFESYYQKPYIDTHLNSIESKISGLSGHAELSHSLTYPLTDETYSIENIPSLSFTSFSFSQTTPTVSVPLPSFNAGDGLVIADISFIIYTEDSSNINAMKDLICSVNTNSDRPVNTSCNKPLIIGKISDDKIYAKYEFSVTFQYGLLYGKSNLYLHFFYEYDKSYPNASFVLDNYIARYPLQAEFSEINIWGFN